MTDQGGSSEEIDTSKDPQKQWSTVEHDPETSLHITHARRRRMERDNIDNQDSEKSVFEDGVIIVPRVTVENVIEAHRISNNYLFGLKKWKSHVTSRPLSERSEIVQELYADIDRLKPVKVSTVRPFNILYVILFGSWLSLLYIIIGCLMMLTVIGRNYGFLCFRLAKYFFWPFGKFVHAIKDYSFSTIEYDASKEEVVSDGNLNEYTTLIHNDNGSSYDSSLQRTSIWRRPVTYLWLILGAPVLYISHFIVFFICWLFVITIPMAKVNWKAMHKILLLPPERVYIGDSSIMSSDIKNTGDIIMYTCQSVNFYYYKYTVDGVNVILLNLFTFVILSVLVGFLDSGDKLTSGTTKCILSVLAFVPLTHYIGMAITSISAQSNFAIGAVLNATFGSLVEMILYILALNKGSSEGDSCFEGIVKSALTGTILVSIIFIPGICMVVGGMKYRTQKFNPTSTGISSLLLFVSVAGVFAPTLYSKLFGDLSCKSCYNNYTGNGTSYGLDCSDCTQSIFGQNGDTSLYTKHIQPLEYSIAIILPLTYIVGLIFTLKTHSAHVYEAFNKQQKEEGSMSEDHGSAQWSRLKSVIILLISAVFIGLEGDIITNNIQTLMKYSNVSEYFVGVTMLSIIPELPEIINGIQFSLQNNVSLGIEIGSSTAIQVCLIQVPLLILVELIHPFGLSLVFEDIHLWSVIFSVIIMNYVLQDGKSDYFQGFVVVMIYLLLMVIYFFSVSPPELQCN